MPALKKKFLFLRPVTSALLLCFISAGLSSPPSAAAAVSSTVPALLPAGAGSIQIPIGIGRAADSFDGGNGKTVILIQDAHSIPAAQRSIRFLLRHFAEKYGVRSAVLEGADRELDPTIFRNFPDRVLLEEVFEEYAARGELAGSTAAAIFGDGRTEYSGAEEWPLYEASLEAFNKAAALEGEILPRLEALRRKIDAEKETVYSPELLELDRAAEGFYGNHSDLAAVLDIFAKARRPPAGSLVKLLWEESRSAGETGARLAIELRETAAAVKLALLGAENKKETAAALKRFHEMDQAYSTSAASAEQFAFFLHGMVRELGPRADGVKFSAPLERLAARQRKLRDIQGTELFTELELYLESVKESFLEGGKAKALDEASARLRLLERYAKLELDTESWQVIKAWLSGGFEGLSSGEKELLSLMKPHADFYEKTEERDRLFFRRTMEVLEKSENRAAVLVAGGFHTGGLLRQLKENGISYLLVTPAVRAMPEETFYRAHIRGETSWKEYYRLENGQVNIYEAFVRAARDRLLEKAGAGKAGLLAKRWRDRLLVSLAEEGRIASAAKYTRFLDELTERKGSRAVSSEEKEKLLRRVRRFLEEFRGLEAEGRLSHQNLLKILKPSTAQTLAGPVTLTDRPVDAGRIGALAAAEARYEFRVQPGEDPVLEKLARQAALEFGLGTVGEIRMIKGGSGFASEPIPLMTTPEGNYLIKKLKTHHIKNKEDALFVYEIVGRLADAGMPLTAVHKKDGPGDAADFIMAFSGGETRSGFYVVERFSAGREISRRDASPEALKSAGRMLGRIHSAAKEITPAYERSAETYSLDKAARILTEETAGWYPNLKPHLSWRQRRLLWKNIAAVRRFRLNDKVKELPLHPIASDFNMGNMIFEEESDEIRSIFDWDNMRMGYAVEDFFPLLSHTGRRGEGYHLENFIRDFDFIYEGYRETAGPLTREELEILPYLFRVQFLNHVSFRSHQLTASGSNKDSARSISQTLEAGRAFFSVLDKWDAAKRAASGRPELRLAAADELSPASDRTAVFLIMQGLGEDLSDEEAEALGAAIGRALERLPAARFAGRVYRRALEEIEKLSPRREAGVFTAEDRETAEDKAPAVRFALRLLMKPASRIKGSVAAAFDFPGEEESLTEALKDLGLQGRVLAVVPKSMKNFEPEGINVQQVSELGRFKKLTAVDNPSQIPAIGREGTAEKLKKNPDLFGVFSGGTVSGLDEYLNGILDKAARTLVGVLLAGKIREVMEAEKIKNLGDFLKQRRLVLKVRGELLKEVFQLEEAGRGFLRFDENGVTVDVSILYRFAEERLAERAVESAA